MNEDKLYDLFLKHDGLRIDNKWTFEYNSRVGCVCVTNGEYAVYCTPFWEDMNGIPIQEYDTGYSSFIPVDKPMTDKEMDAFFDRYLSSIIPFIIVCFERFLQESYQYSK